MNTDDINRSLKGLVRLDTSALMAHYMLRLLMQSTKPLITMVTLVNVSVPNTP